MSQDSGVHDVNNFDLLRLWGESRDATAVAVVAAAVAAPGEVRRNSAGSVFFPADDCGRIRLKLTNRRASGSSQGAIDNRIEQAMDLVKSHLMTAVRSGVEELKEKIIRLEDTISHLQTENDFLKAHVPNEVLAQLHQYTSLAHLAAAGVMLPPSAAQHVVMMPPQPGSSPTGLSSSAPQK